MEILPVNYVKRGELYIAYQVFGEGKIDLILLPGWISRLEVAWEQPRLASTFRRLSSFCSLILIEKRGAGLSGRVSPDNCQNAPFIEVRPKKD